MKIDSIGASLINNVKLQNIPDVNDKKFGNVLNEFIGEVNQTQMDAKQATVDFLSGGNVEIHDVMIAGEKAKTSLDLLVEIRNKTVDMYKELLRMQA